MKNNAYTKVASQSPLLGDIGVKKLSWQTYKVAQRNPIEALRYE
jgi:hypothetical protein